MEIVEKSKEYKEKIIKYPIEIKCEYCDSMKWKSKILYAWNQGHGQKWNNDGVNLKKQKVKNETKF